MLDKHKEKKKDFYESIKNALVFTGNCTNYTCSYCLFGNCLYLSFSVSQLK